MITYIISLSAKMRYCYCAADITGLKYGKYNQYGKLLGYGTDGKDVAI